MHSLAFFLLSLASLCPPITSFAVPTSSYHNSPVCTGVLLDSTVTMQQHCVNTLGATCALVVVFPNATQSGNPDNCGNACDCSASNCPAVPPPCGDGACLGIGSSQVAAVCSKAPINGCACTGHPPYILAPDGDYPSSVGNGNGGEPPTGGAPNPV